MCGSVVFFLKSALLKSASGLHIDIDEIEIAPPPNRWRFACCRYLRETATIVDHSKSQATQIIKVCLSNQSVCLLSFITDLVHVLSFQQVMENGLDVSPAWLIATSNQSGRGQLHSYS